MPLATSNIVKPRAGLVGMSTPNGVKYVDVGGSQAVAHPTTYTPTNPVSAVSTSATNPLGSTQTKGLLSPNYVAPAPQKAPIQSFPSIVGGLVNNANTPPAQNYIQQTSNYGAGNLGIGQQAADIASEYGKRIADTGSLGAKFEAGQRTTGTTPVAEGNAAVTAQTTAAQQQAIAQGEQAALQGIGYQLTGQQQAANASNMAAGQEIAGRGQTLNALSAAGGLAQPQVVAQGQTVFQPTEGTLGGGNFDVGTNASNFAQQVLSGRMTYDQAVQSLGYSNVGKTALDQAITSAGGSPLQLQASGSATQSVIGTQAQQQAAYQSAHQQAQNLQAQLTDLISNLGLNPSDLNAVNAGIQKIAQNTSSAPYKILSNYVADIASRYSQVLTPPGGSATDTTRGVASSMLDSLAAGHSIIDVMNALDQQAQAVIAGVSTTGAGSTGNQTSLNGANPWH